jgi:hypothetical protein
MTIEYIIPKKKTNIHDFIKKYNNKTFILKNDSIEFEVKLEKNMATFIKSKLDFYSVSSNEFYIKFFYKKPSFENVYIDSIAKSDKYSGSDVLKFIIDFLKSFKQVKKAYLEDAAKVNCKNSDDKFDLSMYKLLTSYIGFYQKFGFRLIIDYGKEEDITNIMYKLAKKVANYKVKDILESFKEIINFVIKYKQKIKVKSINNFTNRNPINQLAKFINNIGYLYFVMGPYKKYKFGQFIEKLNNKKCFMLSQLFTSLNFINYIEFSYENKKIIPDFLIDYHKLYIYKDNFNWQGYLMKKF